MYIYFLEESIINLVPSPFRLYAPVDEMMSLQKLVQWSSKEEMSVALGTPWSIGAQFWLYIAVYSFIPLTHFSLDEDSSLQWRYCEHWYHEKVSWIMILWRSIVKPRLPLHQPVTMIFLQSTRWREAPMPFHRAFCSLALQKLSKFAKRHIFRSLLSARLNCRCIRLCFKGNQWDLPPTHLAVFLIFKGKIFHHNCPFQSLWGFAMSFPRIYNSAVDLSQ